MKKLSILLFALVLPVVLFAAGGQDAVSEDGDVTIRVLSRWSDEMPTSIYFREVIEEINAADNGIIIEGEHINDETSYLDKLRTQFAIGEYPNVFYEYGGSRIVDYVESGLLMDLQPALDADPTWRDSYLPLFDKWQYDQFPGTFGIPAEFYAVTIFYNEEIFNKVGVSAPATLDEFEMVCDKLLAAGYVPLALGEKDVWRAGHFLNNLVMKSFGSQGVTDLANRDMSYDDPKMIALYSKIQEYFEKGYFGKDAVTVDYNMEQAMFHNEETAMHMDGSWYCGNAAKSEIASKIKAFPFPAVNNANANSFQGGAGGGWSIVNIDEKHNAAAVEFVKTVSNPDFFKVLQVRNKGGVYPAVFKSDASVVDTVTISHAAAITNASEFRDDIQTYDSLSSMLDTCRTALQGLFIGKTPSDTAAQIMAEIKANE